MIRDHDRSGWFGASDTARIMGRWDTQTFEKWWLVKMGLRRESCSTRAMQTGTALEHRILDHLGVLQRDRQVKVRNLRLRVNLDGEDRKEITEVKTYSAKSFHVSNSYWMQCQVEMFASGCHFRHRKNCKIASYQVEPEDYLNWFRPIEDKRLSFWPIEYDRDWVQEAYLPKVKYLARCLKSGTWPKEGEYAGGQN